MMDGICYPCSQGQHADCYGDGRWIRCNQCKVCRPELLVAIFANGRRGYCPLSCSDADCESFIAQTRAMGANAFAVIPDTADFCEEAI